MLLWLGFFLFVCNQAFDNPDVLSGYLASCFITRLLAGKPRGDNRQVKAMLRRERDKTSSSSARRVQKAILQIVWDRTTMDYKDLQRKWSIASILISGHQKVSGNGSVLSFEYLFATHRHIFVATHGFNHRQQQWFLVGAQTGRFDIQKKSGHSLIFSSAIFKVKDVAFLWKRPGIEGMGNSESREDSQTCLSKGAALFVMWFGGFLRFCLVELIAHCWSRSDSWSQRSDCLTMSATALK